MQPGSSHIGIDRCKTEMKQFRNKSPPNAGFGTSYLRSPLRGSLQKSSTPGLAYYINPNGYNSVMGYKS